MSGEKFTAGPWVAQWSKYDDEAFIVQAGHPTYRVLASFDGDGVSDAPDEQSIANAHLIAAAPDLYATVERLIAVFEPSGMYDDEIFDHAKGALAKARGETP